MTFQYSEMKSYKTPLRYPGGKSRAAAKLYPQFPDYVKEFREPFLGGGSMAIYFSKENPDTPVWVNDTYFYLYNFWVQLQDRGYELSDTLMTIKNHHDNEVKAKQLFQKCKADIANVSEFQQAVYFYILNKCSFSGLTENSSFSKQASVSNFSKKGIRKLAHYGQIIEHWEITNDDYSELMTDDKDVFCFLDPPYDIKDFLYGTKGSMHKGFDHQRFASVCNESTCKWMITYNSNENTRGLFPNHKQTEWDLTYTMRSTGGYNAAQSKRKELLITNYVKAPQGLPFN